MKVAITVSQPDLRGGGDAIFLQTLLRTNHAGVQYHLPGGLVTFLGRNVARLCGRLSVSIPLPLRVRSRLFYLSYFTYISSDAAADVIHAHGFLPWGPSSNLPIVWVTAGSNRAYEDYFGQRPELYLAVWQAALRRAQVVVCWTHSGAQWISKVCGIRLESIRVISPFVVRPPGLERRPEDDSDSAAVRLIYVGADARRKGLDVAIRAFRKLADEYPSLELHVVGPRGGNSSWSHPRIRFWGPCDSLRTWSLLFQSHIFVLPTYAETFGLAVLEAIAAGLAVVASRIEPMMELINDGQDGFLAAPGDAEDLAAKIGSLISDPTLRRRMAKAAGAKWEQNYSEAVVIPKLLSAYLAALESFQGGNRG